MTSFVRASRLILLTLSLSGCGQGGPSAKATEKPVAGSSGTAVNDPLPPLAYESALPEPLRAMIASPFTGDLDGRKRVG